MTPWTPEFQAPNATPDAGAQAFAGLGDVIRQVVQAHQAATARKSAQKVADLKLAEETPSTAAGSIFPGAPSGLNLTRAEAARGWEKRAEIDAARRAAAAAKGGSSGMPMTPGRKAADTTFGRDYVDFSTTGQPAAEKGLSALQGAREELRTKGKDLTGSLQGSLPDSLLSIYNPEALAVKERIRGAVQNTLKATLGSAFTEAEGERIFNNAFNPRLSPEENINRLDRIIGELQAQKTSKENMGQYFEEKGTLTGYQQPRNSAPSGGPRIGEIEEGHRFKGGNPADPNAWEPVQ